MSAPVKFPELTKASIEKYITSESVEKDDGKRLMGFLKALDHTELCWMTWLILSAMDYNQLKLLLANSPISEAGLNGILALGKFMIRPERLEEFRKAKVLSYVGSLPHSVRSKLGDKT